MNSASATTLGPLATHASHGDASRLHRGYLLSWLGFAYVSLFSMWLGFFAWDRALALGGTVRVSQVQLLQPFLSIVAAVPILGESVDTATCVFLLAVMGVVFASRRVASFTSVQGSKP